MEDAPALAQLHGSTMTSRNFINFLLTYKQLLRHNCFIDNPPGAAMKIVTDVEIVLQQESDTVAQVNGDLSTLEFVARTRDRIVLLEARWQACGLPQGDATKTLRSVALRAHAESSGV